MKVTPAFLKAEASGDVENMLAALTPGGIEAQEHLGQMKLAMSSTLPKDGTQRDREKYERIGVVFGDDADDLFVKVTLPAGWRIRPTGHSMWSDLVDDKERVRAKMFYKAAFYDRSAHISLTRRYQIESYRPCDAAGATVDLLQDKRAEFYRTVVVDGDADLHVAGVRKENDYRQSDVDHKLAEAWLDANLPRWKNELAYWNE